MTAERFSLDTNILVYAADRLAGDKHQRAVDLLYAAAALDCVLTVQCLAEFFRVVTRKNTLPVKTAVALIEDWRIQFPVAAADGAALSAAIEQVARGHLAFWDALLLETARTAGCQILLSEDFQQGRSYGGVVVLDPLRAPVPARLARLLGR
jgi:predicted nucleic acid-binding protein